MKVGSYTAVNRPDHSAEGVIHQLLHAPSVCCGPPFPVLFILGTESLRVGHTSTEAFNYAVFLIKYILTTFFLKKENYAVSPEVNFFHL